VVDMTGMAGTLGQWPPNPTPPAVLRTAGRMEAKMPKTYTQISMRFGVDELDRIDAAARRVHMSRTAWIKAACAERLERQQGGQAPDQEG